MGNIELALFDSSISPEMAQYLDTIQKLANDTADRIRQLQKFAGKQTAQTQHKSVDLNRLVEDAIVQTRHLWKDFALKEGISITIERRLQPNITVLGNPGELRTALFNIIKNSVQAMPQGGKIIFHSFLEDIRVHLVISDTGMGMDESTRARIFQPFFSTKGFDQGKGLGMSGAYSIIKDHGGRIFVKDSVLGEGTAIEIILPCTDKEKEAPLPPPTNATKARILWVDDEQMIRDYAQVLLEKFDHRIHVAQSGDEALNLLGTNQYDLLITDVGMPGMNGWQLAEQAHEMCPQLPIAVITGWGNEITPSVQIERHIRHILAKPVNLKQIQELIADVMQPSPI